MKTKFLLISILSIFLLGSIGCNNNNAPGCSTAWASELADEIEAMQNAAIAYSTNPTQANCLAYKAAIQAYIDALEPYGNCTALTGQDKAEWQAAIDQARQDVNDMDCS